MIWETTTLNEVALNIQTGPFGSQLHQSDYSADGVPVVMPKDLIGGQISEQTIARVSNSHVERLRRHKIHEGDILYARRGDVGRCAYATQKETNWLCGTGCLRISIDRRIAIPKFIYYSLQLPKSIGWVENHAVGATMLNLNTSILSKVPVSLPPLPTQKRIADILSAYDDLIENNRKQIKLLEEAAQRLYKEWFVDLRFPGYENTKIVDGVPEGWKYVSIGDTIEYEIGGGWGQDDIKETFEAPAYVIRGTDFYGITHGNFSDLPFRYHKQSNLNGRKLIDGDIIFEVSGGSKTEGVAKTVLIRNKFLEQLNQPVMCASFCKLIRTKESAYSQILYDSLQYMRASGITNEFDKRSASSIVNYRWKDFLAQRFIFMPNDKLIKQYNLISKNIYENILIKSISIEIAKQARDRLLPKLMSGEIAVYYTIKPKGHHP